MKIKLYTNKFYGHELSEHALKYGRVDYAALSQAVNPIYHSSIMDKADDWELVSGSLIDDDGNPVEIMQTYIVGQGGQSFCKSLKSLYFGAMT